MTSEATHPLRETYESLRDSVENTEARAAWLDADRRKANLSETYRTLKDDPRYTEEHKASQMWERYEKESEHIQAAGQKARDLLEKEAKGHEMMALPHPKGENLHGVSTERLIAAQNEASRIARKLDRLENMSGPKSFKPAPSQVLKDEYAKGIEVGGVEGAARCKGVLMAADELGIPEEAFLDDLRTPEQHKRLDKARRALFMAQHIGSHIPEPPLRRRPGASQGMGTYGAGNKLILPKSRTKPTAKSPPGWISR
jgi:hypothetical protein